MSESASAFAQEGDIEIEHIIDPELPIVDAHHHLWILPDAALQALEQETSLYAQMLAPVLRRSPRYLFEDYLRDASSGHNVQASVYVDAGAMYKLEGPDGLKSLGEVEFANGVAAMAASGVFGPTQVCAAIVGSVDLRLGEGVEDILVAHIQAGGGRYRGVRAPMTAHDPDISIMGADNGAAHLLLDPNFRNGLARLSALRLSLDVLLFEPQLPELLDTAREFSDTQFVLNHVGVPLAIGPYSAHRAERFDIWRENIRALALCPNVAVKLSGMGVPFGGFPSYLATPRRTAPQLAEEWRPHFETCIEAFGAERCMFASNYPVDASVASYAALWNAFKHIASAASYSEKQSLFSGTARAIYRL